MKKLVILTFLILSLFAVQTKAWERTSLGPDLIIESLTLSPYPVEPGEEFELTFKIRNSNTRKTIKSPKIWIEEAYPFTSLSNPKVKILDSLVPNEETILTFRLKADKNAINTVNDLKIRFQEYVEEGSNPIHTSEPIKIDIKSSGIELSIASVKTIPEEIYPGNEAQIKLILKNNLPVIMKNIDVSFNFDSSNIPFTPLGTTSHRTLTALNKGNEKEFLFDIAIDADAEPKIYKLNLNIDYEDEFGNSYNINTTTGIKISTTPELQLDLEKSEILHTKTPGEITIRISNKGLADIKFLTVKLQPSKDYKIISNSQVYIGNVESDDYETVDFTIYANSYKKLPIKLLLTYKDAFNKQYEKQATVYIPLYSNYDLSKFGLKSNGSILKIIFYIILISFIYLSFREWRKTRDIPLALKKALRILLVKIKRIIKSIRPSTLKRGFRAIVRFFKEP